MSYLTGDEKQNLYEVFLLFDERGDQEVKTDLMGLIMRNLGQVCSEEEVAFYKKKVDPLDRGTFKFPEFLNLIEEKMIDTSSKEVLKNALEVFEDKEDEGFLHADELRNYLTTIGDKLTDEEVTEFYREIEINDDEEIEIDEIVEVLTSQDFYNFHNRPTLEIPPFTSCKPTEEESGCLSLD